MSTVRRHIHHGTYVNWFVLVVVSAIGATGLLLSLPALASRFNVLEVLEDPQGVFFFIAAGSLLVIGGLILQRRDLQRLWRQYQAAQKEVADSAEKHRARVYALLNVSKMMVAQNDLEAVFDCVTKTCVKVFNCHQASLMTFDKDSNSLEVRAVSGKMVPQGMLGTKQKLGTGIAGWVGQRREPLLILPGAKPSDYPEIEFKHRELTAAMVVPIILRDELVGVINVSSRNQSAQFDSEDLRALLVFAENVGAAIRHTEQAEWMRATIRHLQSQKQRSGVHPAVSTPGTSGPDAS